MKKRFLLLVIFIIFLFSWITFIFIFNYLDPYKYKILAMISIIFTSVLWLSSLLTIILYFFKKIYFRWEVYIYHVLSSFRQWFLVSLFVLFIIFLNSVWASLLLTWGLSLIIFIFLELFIQNLENN
jgi:hypothetical protein